MNGIRRTAVFLWPSLVAVGVAAGAATAWSHALEVDNLVPANWARVHVDSTCPHSRALVEMMGRHRASTALPVAFFPASTGTPMDQLACDLTIERLAIAGVWWVDATPRHWVCQRLVEHGAEQASIDVATPSSVLADGTHLTGFSPELVARLGSPALSLEYRELYATALALQDSEKSMASTPSE